MELLAQNIPLIVAGAVFFAIIAVVWAVRVFLNPERTARDRIADLTGRKRTADPLLQPDTERGLASNIGALAKPKDKDEAEELRSTLMQAGYRNANALEIFSAIRAAATLGAVIIIPILPDTKLVYKAFAVMVLAAIGYYLPLILVNNSVTKRKEALMKPFPDALDLLVSSVEAGLGLDAAFRRVAAEMRKAGPELSRELELVNHEVSAGIPRTQALRRLDRRTGLEEVNSLVNVLMQAERFGTSVARALRIHSDLVRKKRMLAAEEQASKISPKLTVCMILFIFPSLVIVLAGPAVINVMRNLIPLLEGR